jgi:hypothetical protein
MDDSADKKDYMEGDDIYDSTDIWRAVQRELRHKTTYGQRTIADQARGVFQKRNLHPHLQFIQMFEMEINEIVSFGVKYLRSCYLNLSDIPPSKGLCYVQQKCQGST